MTIVILWKQNKCSNCNYRLCDLTQKESQQASSQGTDLNVYCGTKLQQQFGQGDVAYASSLVESCSILIFSINLHKDRDSARDTFTRHNIV